MVAIAPTPPRLLVLLLAGTLGASAGTAAPLAVPLAVEEAAGVARRAFPASASVPLPRGRVRAADRLWLAAPDGGAAPAQTRALERWPDGSVRWLLVDFLADVPAGAHATYTLRDGAPARAPAGPRIRFQRKGAARLLDTGPLRAVVPEDGSELVTHLAAGTRGLGPIPLPRLATNGALGGRPTPARLQVETEGPVRTELLLAGRHPEGLAYEVRLAVFAGQPFLRVQHTVVNLADAHYLPVRGLALALPGRFVRATMGIDGGSREFTPLAGAHVLRHADATPALLDGGAAGRHADGWARAAGDGLALTVVARDLWQEYPKSIRVAPDGIVLDLFAAGDDPVQLGSGAAKTHELWLALEPEDAARPPAELAAALRAPLVASVPTEWSVASRALPLALAPDGPGAHDFLARLARAVADYEQYVQSERWDDGPPVPCAERTVERPRVGLYGALNWGDWQFPGYRDDDNGCDAWGNLEYDLPQVLGLGWVATGSRLFWDALVPAARHYRDVDIIHHSAEHPDWVGLNHPHKASHFAFESPKKVDLGHTWAEGLVTYHRLTGEARALEAARRLADALAPRASRARNPRQFGWPMLALVAVHDATGEHRYLDAARAYADGGLAAFEPSPATGDWKMGILADGLAAVHAATGDERFRRWLVAYADAYLEAPGRFADARYALPLGYLAALTGDERYARAALAAARELRLGTWGKPLAAMGRTGFRLLAPLQSMPGRASATPGPVTPSGRKPPKRP